MITIMFLLIILAVAGIVNTSYLTYKYVMKQPTKCIVFPNKWCDAVMTSKQSKTFGIPNSLLGLIFYAMILVLSALFIKGLAPFWPIAVIITIGFGFSVYFTVVQSYILHAFCAWCVISAIDSLIMFMIVLAVLIGSIK